LTRGCRLGVKFDWSWRVTTLPSLVGENTLGTHDYLSIAVEFDNGQDMTYLWSSSLAVGNAFRCPALPARIVAVWLIALSPFQRRMGECAYRGIRLIGQSAFVWIGP
jgi:hypothetical protein